MSDSISFARGAPHPDALRADIVADCARRALEADGTRILSYGDGRGYAPLRETLGAIHGVPPEQVFITNGSLQGFVFMLETELAPGDLVAVEAPTYDRALLQLEGHGMRVLPLPVAEDGLDVDMLAAACARGDVPKLLYTIPNFQNPSGATLGEAKRVALLELADRYDIRILEDDPYGRLRFEGAALEGLFERSGPERTMFTSSFSKTVAPGLRVGYIVAPRDVADRLAAIANRTYISPSFLAQGAIDQLIGGGHLEASIAHVTDLMRARRDAMVAELGRMPDGTECTPPEGGFFLWMTLPEGYSADALFSPAKDAGVVYVKGSDCFASGGERSLRLAYSGVSPDEISEGMRRLGAVFSGSATPAA